MNVTALLASLETMGIVLRVQDDRLFYRPRRAVPVQLLGELREHKKELLDLLAWPTESSGCWETLRSRLVPLVGKTVSTPSGLGRVVAALPEFVSVQPLADGEGRLSFSLPCEISMCEDPDQESKAGLER